ncbi:hypothetical protein ES703_60404 [subsurface metagenome]
MSIDIEILKALLNVIVAIFTLIFGLFVGKRLAVYWAIRQKRKEIELNSLNQFYELYGEFFSIWKLWNWLKENKKENSPAYKEKHWKLLNRACIAEAKVETILLKITSERYLSKEDIANLGRFRQAYQTLGEFIKYDNKIEWYYSENPEYLSFKKLSVSVASLLRIDTIFQEKLPNPKEGFKAFKKVTSNLWEDNWLVIDNEK